MDGVARSRCPFRSKYDRSPRQLSPVGLPCMAVTKVLESSRVVAVDNSPSRIHQGLTFSPTETYVRVALRAGRIRGHLLREESNGVLQKGERPGGTFVRVDIIYSKLGCV